jgi:Uma2 family endonuclease
VHKKSIAQPALAELERRTARAEKFADPDRIRRFNFEMKFATQTTPLPMTIPLMLPNAGTFSDQELVKFCAQNPDIGIERDEHGRISIDMSPSYILTSSNNSELTTEIGLWNRKTKAGKVIDSNGGFFLKDRSMRAPDVAWIRRERWEALSQAEKKSIPHLVPDFVIELLSDTDSLKKTQKKMEKWIKNGVRLAWLVNTRSQQTEIYRPGQPTETQPFSATLSGEAVLDGFETILADILEA